MQDALGKRVWAGSAKSQHTATHMYPTSDYDNFGWLMDWLDALSVSTLRVLSASGMQCCSRLQQ